MKAILSIFLFFTCFFGFAQINTPPPSPSSQVKQIVGLTEIEVEYNRPSKRGRVIFGNLVPYGKLWRTGANSNTKINFSTDVELNGNKIKAGTYSIFSIPNKNSWEIILYSESDLWGVPKNWDDKKIIFRSDYQLLKNSQALETFSISFSDISNDYADLIIAWDDTYVKIKIDVLTRQKVQGNIESVMSKSPKSSDYYSAAVYYRQENINLGIALEWINKAMQMSESPKFYQLRQQSLIMAANEKYSDAVKVAQKSLELSIKEDNQDYVKMNTESIQEWSNKL
jgi:hypothetical protein